MCQPRCFAPRRAGPFGAVEASIRSNGPPHLGQRVTVAAQGRRRCRTAPRLNLGQRARGGPARPRPTMTPSRPTGAVRPRRPVRASTMSPWRSTEWSRLLHARDCRPVGGTLVELQRGAHGVIIRHAGPPSARRASSDARGCGWRSFSQPSRVVCRRHRTLPRPHRLDQAQRMVGVAHQGRSPTGRWSPFLGRAAPC